MPGEDEGIPKPPELPEGVYEEVDEHGVVTLRDADGEERKVTDGEVRICRACVTHNCL